MKEAGKTLAVTVLGALVTWYMLSPEYLFAQWVFICFLAFWPVCQDLNYSEICPVSQGII